MPTTRANSYNSQNIAMLAALTLIWGSSYILIKRGLIAFSPIQLASLRISITCLCSLPVLFRALKAVPRHKYFTLLQMGLFSSGIPAFLFALSMTHSSSSVNGILNSLSPLWTILIGYFFYRVAITRQKVLGVVIGFLGAIVLVLGKKGGVFKFDIVYSFLPVVATFCYGLGTNITKQKLQDENPLYCTAIAMSMIGLPAIVIAFYTEVPAVIVSGTAWVSVAAVAALSVFGTFIAWVIFYRLVQRTDALFAASVTYLVPVVAIAWGLTDGEMLAPVQLLGMVLILTGVYFTTSMQNKAIARLKN